MRRSSKIFQGMVTMMMGAFLIAGMASNALAEEKEKIVLVTGVAALQGENITAAREKAVQDALRQAVEQGVGMMMNATSIVKNDDLLEKIYTNTQGYIAQYTIIKQRKDTSGLYRVKVQATVKTGELRDSLVRLGIIKAMMDYPRILVLQNPQIENPPLAQASESVLIKGFTDKHFDVVDASQIKKLHEETRELFKVDTAENAAARIGLKHYAEIVVLYSLKVGTAEFDGAMEQAPVSLRTKAIVTTTAQILTAGNQSATGVGRSAATARENAAEKAGQAVSGPLISEIVSWWTDYIANGIPFIITLKTGVKSDRQVIAFERAIESIPGVVSLSERSSGGGITEMMVKYKGTGADFKRAVFETLPDQSGFENLHTVASKGRFLVFSVD